MLFDPYDNDDYEDAMSEARTVLRETGGSTEIRWETGKGMWDVKHIIISNNLITNEEREILKKCNKNHDETEKNLMFFLLRLYRNYSPNYETYVGQWKYYHPEKAIDQTEETFKSNRSKWYVPDGVRIITNFYTIPYISRLIVK